MSNIPVEGSRAGDILAIMTVLAPVSSVLFSSFIKSKAGAFVVAVSVSGTIIAGSLWIATDGVAKTDSMIGPVVFGSWAGGVSLFMALVITIGRTIITSPEVSSPPSEPGPNQIN